jgi:protein PhnA
MVHGFGPADVNPGDPMLDDLIKRSNNLCELCGDIEELSAYTIDAEHAVLVCATCSPQLVGEITDTKHWYCLQGTIWSEEPAVACVSWRMLNRLKHETWAAEALDGAFLDEAILALAQAGAASDEGPTVVDSNGATLADGDSVTLIKDLVVKGANFTAKRGTMVKNIRLGFDPSHVEGKVNKQTIMLKTCFLKRA